MNINTMKLILVTWSQSLWLAFVLVLAATAMAAAAAAAPAIVKHADAPDLVLYGAEYAGLDKP